MGDVVTSVLPASHRPCPSSLPACSTQHCPNPGERSRGCNVCQAVLTTCSVHLVSTFHNCITVLGHSMISAQRTAEIAGLLKNINMPALLALASSLNANRACTLTPGSTSLMGCVNYHLRLDFASSSEKWIVRVPRPSVLALGRADVEYMYACEYATLKFLEDTSVPAPRAFAFDVASNRDNRVGTTYLIMEFLDGDVFDVQNASVEAKKRVYRDVAEIMAELSRHPLPKACSLFLGNARSGSAVDMDRISGLRSKMVPPFGPFDSAREYYEAVAELHLDLIAERNLYPEFGVEAYLAYLVVRDSVASWVESRAGEPALAGEGEVALRATPEREESKELFYLTHIDAKGDHLLVSPSGHVTGIIDWENARFAPFAEAFGPSLLTADMHSLYSGEVGLTHDDHLLADALAEAGVPALADAMRADERARRLHFGLGSARAEKETWDLIRGLLRAFGGYSGETFGEWKEAALQRYRGDVKLEALLRWSGEGTRQL